MKIDIKICRKIIMLSLILTTILFIFIQSMLSPEASENESDSVGEVIVDTAENIIGNETEAEKSAVESVRRFVEKHLRKLAHFLEYALLGAEMLVLLYFERGTQVKGRFKPPIHIKYCIISVVFAVLVAFFDETVQHFSGRGPAITDMWIDIAGYTTATVIAYAILFCLGKRVEQEQAN